MAISHYVTTVIQGANSSAPSGSVDAGTDADRVMVGDIHGMDNASVWSIDTCTYNSVSCTGQATEVDYRSDTCSARQFTLDDPATGSNTFQANFSESIVKYILHITVWHGADTVTGAVTNTGTSGNPSVNIAAGTSTSVLQGSLSTAVGVASNSFTPGDEETELADSFQGGSGADLVVYTGWIDPNDTATHDFDATPVTTGHWAALAIEVTEVAASPTSDVPRRRWYRHLLIR